MRRPSAFILHALAAAIMAWGWFSLLAKPVDPALTRKGGHFQFLTNQGLLVAWACMGVSLFSDVYPFVKAARDVKRALLMISLPLAFVITSIYWSLLLFLPHLLLSQAALSQTPPGTLPRPLDLPLSLDLVLHASPIIALLIDFIAFEPRFSKLQVWKAAPASVLAFTVWYASLVEYCATFNGSFPYPFLTHSPFPVRVMIYTATAGISLACFGTLNALHP